MTQIISPDHVNYTATYSPDDNKLRLYSVNRLDPETFAGIKSMGFRWAPKQELFVAPLWTPGREDLLIHMCGEVGDEDSSLMDRAEERAARFDEYSDKRADDAERVNSDFGNTDIVGHHSAHKAQKIADKIQNGRENALKLWQTSEYWEDRAEGAIFHAKYKELPAVRARRIKKLSAEMRKHERNLKDLTQYLKLWSAPGLTRDKAMEIANYDYVSMKFPLEKYPRELPTSQYEDLMSFYSALTENIVTVEQAVALIVPGKTRNIARTERWIEHYQNRIKYETAMLNEQGESDLLKPKARPKQLPLVNYRAPDGLLVKQKYSSDLEQYNQVEMTKAEFQKIHPDDRWTVSVNNSHRVRFASRGSWVNHDRFIIFLTDSKVHKIPEPIEADPIQGVNSPPRLHEHIQAAPRKKRERPDLYEMEEAVKKGVQVVSANQLFPTPEAIAEQMAEIANVQPGEKVLEPSAGTGNLIKAIFKTLPDDEGINLTAVEINADLAISLSANGYASTVENADFLDLQNGGSFDKIIMNPPFEKGTDIKHIKHAASMLAPGGLLVALCAGGPRQKAQLEPLADYWEPLPEGSFKAQGTNISVVLLTIQN